MNSKGYQGYHKSGKRYNGGVSNSSYGYQGPQSKGYQGYENQNPSYGYGSQRQDGYQKPKESYNSYNKDSHNDERMQFNYNQRPETQQTTERPFNQGMKVQA